MPAGLSLPLQLAANLVALGAAAGLAAVTLLRLGARDTATRARLELSEWLVVAGALALMLGHGVDGGLVPGRGPFVGWSLAVGLALVAAGARPARLPQPPGAEPAPSDSDETEESEATATTALVPALGLVATPPLAASAVGAAAGVIGALRLALGGRANALVAVALLLWGAARGLQTVDMILAAFCTIGGAVALGAWIWQITSTQLRAKIVVAFVATLLGLVAALAVVLSMRGAADIVHEEWVTLGTSARDLANQISREWPAQTVFDLGRGLSHQQELLTELVERDDADELGRIADLFLREEQLAVLDLRTQQTALISPAPGLEELTDRLDRTSVARRLAAGDAQAEGIVAVDDTIVALGGVRVSDGPDEDVGASRWAVIGARPANQAWAEEAAGQLPFAVLLEIDHEPVAAYGVTDPQAVLDTLGPGPSRGLVSVGDDSLFAAAEEIADPATGETLGRVVTVRAGGALAQLQRDQARNIFVLALLGALGGAVVAGTVAGRLLAPVQRLTAAAAAVGAGRLDATAAVDSPDEIGRLGRTFDSMTASLASQAQQLRDAADEQARLRARLEAITSSMSDGLLATDRDGTVITLNPAAAWFAHPGDGPLEGRPLDEVVVLRGGQLWESVGGPSDPDVRTGRLLLVAGEGSRLIPSDVTAAPVRDAEDRLAGRVLVLRDATREAELERMKTEFLANVSHELRTPLTPIRGFADVLTRQQVAPGDARRYAEHIRESAERMQRVVARIVEFAALDSGRSRPRMEDIDVGELVDEVVRRWRTQAPERTVRRHVARTLPPARTDRELLARCLDELVDNAVKFSPSHEPVTVSATWAGDKVKVTVRDRGCGFEPDRAAALFGDFYQIDASETRHFGGLGLGLALVRRSVDVLGGDATVEAAPERGAAFHLLIPTASSPKAPSGPEPSGSDDQHDPAAPVAHTDGHGDLQPSDDGAREGDRLSSSPGVAEAEPSSTSRLEPAPPGVDQRGA